MPKKQKRRKRSRVSCFQMESIKLVLIGNTYIDSVAILATAKNSQFTSRKMYSTCLRI